MINHVHLCVIKRLIARQLQSLNI